MSNLSSEEQTKILDEYIWCTHHKERKIECWLSPKALIKVDVLKCLIANIRFYYSKLTII